MGVHVESALQGVRRTLLFDISRYMLPRSVAVLAQVACGGHKRYNDLAARVRQIEGRERSHRQANTADEEDEQITPSDILTRAAARHNAFDVRNQKHSHSLIAAVRSSDCDANLRRRLTRFAKVADAMRHMTFYSLDALQAAVEVDREVASAASLPAEGRLLVGENNDSRTITAYYDIFQTCDLYAQTYMTIPPTFLSSRSGHVRVQRSRISRAQRRAGAPRCSMAQRPRNTPQQFDASLLATKLSTMKMQAQPSPAKIADAPQQASAPQERRRRSRSTSSSRSGRTSPTSSSRSSYHARRRKGPPTRRARRGRSSPSRSPARRRLPTPATWPKRSPPRRPASEGAELSPLLEGPSGRGLCYIVKVRRGMTSMTLYTSLTKMMAKDLVFGGTSFRRFDTGELMTRGYSILYLQKRLKRFLVDEDVLLVRSKAGPMNLVFVLSP